VSHSICLFSLHPYLVCLPPDPHHQAKVALAAKNKKDKADKLLAAEKAKADDRAAFLKGKEYTIDHHGNTIVIGSANPDKLPPTLLVAQACGGGSGQRAGGQRAEGGK
jgi:hypothetical protein